MASGVQPSKDDHRSKAPLTKSTSLTVGVKPTHRGGAGCSSTSKSSAGSGGVSALMLQEMEDLRSLSIGSPVPVPHTDDDESIFAGVFDGETYPSIRIDRCTSAVTAEGSPGQDNGPSRRSEGRTVNGRSREEVTRTKSLGAQRSSATNHSKSEH